MDMITKTFEAAGIGELRTVIINGEAWFLGVDIGTCLGYINPGNAYKSHTREKYRKVLSLRDFTETMKSEIWTNPADKKAKVFVCEAGLYQMIFEAKTDQAIVFQDWVYEEVLPSIRQNGIYVSGQEEMDKELKDMMIRKLSKEAEFYKNFSEKSAKKLKELIRVHEKEEEELKAANERLQKENNRLYSEIRKASIEAQPVAIKEPKKVITGMESKNMYIDPKSGLWMCASY